MRQKHYPESNTMRTDKTSQNYTLGLKAQHGKWCQGQTFDLEVSMKRNQLLALCLSSLVISFPAVASPAHPCAQDAIRRAGKLLALHTDGNQRGSIAKTTTVLPPVRNPANSQQKFDVVAVSGFVYKAEYRMRFLYAQIPGECVLVGQEILEHASL